MHKYNNKHRGNFGLEGIGNVDIDLQIPLTVTYLANLSGGNVFEIQLLNDRVRSDIIDKESEGSITKTSIKKLSIHCGGYEWTYDGVS